MSVSELIRFHVTEEHLKLLRAANVQYEDGIEWGAAAIDPKRPYGNGDLYGDIARLVGIEPGPDEYDPFTEAERERMMGLHRDLATVLQIVLLVGRFEAGEYEADRYFRNWRPA